MYEIKNTETGKLIKKFTSKSEAEMFLIDLELKDVKSNNYNSYKYELSNKN